MEDQYALALRNAEKLRALNARIDETFKRRHCSASDLAAWKNACYEFHRDFGGLFFPGGVDAWSAFISGTGTDVEPVIAFLEADPWSFRSGYHKQILWNRLKRTFLTAREIQRLETVALSYLEKRVRWEFWHMARFARHRGSSSFWQAVESLAASEARTPAAIKAAWLLRYRCNEDIRRYVGNEVRRAKYQSGYVPKLDVPIHNAA
jgi:hypothetical protein